jgi:D-lactate dehydrogenase (cytochrome)
MAKEALRLGGTISAEHGIGKLRIPYLRQMVGEEGLKQMARVKLALDPNGILSPGNIIPVELLHG